MSPGDSWGSSGSRRPRLALQRQKVLDNLSWKTRKTTISFLSLGPVDPLRTEVPTIPRVPRYSKFSDEALLSRFTQCARISAQTFPSFDPKRPRQTRKSKTTFLSSVARLSLQFFGSFCVQLDPFLSGDPRWTRVAPQSSGTRYHGTWTLLTLLSGEPRQSWTSRKSSGSKRSWQTWFTWVSI